MTMQVIHKGTDWHGVRQKLVTEARERRCSGRGLTLQQKSQTTSIFAILRKELAEDESIKNTVRKVLTRTPKEPRELESGDKKRKPTKVSHTVNMTKERFFVRHDTVVKEEEITRIRTQFEEKERHVAALEAKSQVRFKQFEDMIQTAAQSAQRALKEMEQWRRKRASLAQPIIDLTNSISALRSKNIALKVTLESNMYMKLFIDCVTDNFTRNYCRPSTLESYQEKHQNATDDPFRPMIEVNDVIAEIEDLEDRNLRMIESFQTSQDNLDEAVKHFALVEKRKDVELKHMQYQKYLINSTLQRCTERGNELQFFCQTFAEGDNERGFFDKDEQLLTLRHYVRRVYHDSVCFMSEIELNVDTLDMLTAIETRMEDLIDTEATMKPNQVRDALRDLERVRRVKLNEDQEAAKKEHQQMRTEQALKRLNAAKATRGRKLMKRSPPRDGIKKESLHTLLDDLNVQLEHDFFFAY